MESKTEISNRLKYTENKLFALAHHLNDAILAEDADRRVLLVNKRFTEIFPLDLVVEDYAGARGYELFILLRSQFKEEHIALNYLEQMTMNRRLVLNEEIKLHDGRFLEVDFIPFGSDGSDSGHIFVIRDVSKVKQTQTLIEKQRAMMAESARITALGEMSAGIAHEINNPLAVIHAKASLLSRNAENNENDPERVKEYSDAIKNTAIRIGKIVKGLKNITRDGSQDPMTEVLFQDLIDETLAFCQERFAQHGIQVKIKNADPTLKIFGKIVQISQVILNLLNNSCDVLEGKEAPWIEISATQNEQFTLIRVTDSGGGIAPEVYEKMFNPFFTTKAPGKGTGLGLSISKMILEKHGGDIRYVTGPHTAFELALPKSSSH